MKEKRTTIKQSVRQTEPNRPQTNERLLFVESTCLLPGPVWRASTSDNKRWNYKLACTACTFNT